MQVYIGIYFHKIYLFNTANTLATFAVTHYTETMYLLYIVKKLYNIQCEFNSPHLTVRV